MPRKGHRDAVEDGISRDGSGFAVRVSVGSGRFRRTRERRYAPTADLSYLRAQRAQIEADLRAELQQHPETKLVERGTLAADVRAYLKRMDGMLDPATYRSRASELKAWTKALGDERSRFSVRPSDIDRAMASWRQAGVSPKTVLNRLRTLKHVYRTLDGKRARTPADNITPPKVTRQRPRDVDALTIRRVIANLIRHERNGRLRDAKTRARFLVRVVSGQRPSQIMRTTPSDVDLNRRIWWVPAGKGGDPVPLPLNDDLLMAWRLFVVADAWGTFDTVSFARVVRRAGWPDGVRVYNARHSVGIALSEAGEDLGDIQAWMGHAQIQTTRNAYVPLLFSRLKSMSDRMDYRVDPSPRWARYVGTPPEARKKRHKS